MKTPLLQLNNNFDESVTCNCLPGWCPPTGECMPEYVCGPDHWCPPDNDCHPDCCPSEPCPTKENSIYDNIFC